MKQEIIQIEKSDESKQFFRKVGSTCDYKQCPYCGQRKIPFKKGVCIAPGCGRQVGPIRYVTDPQKFAEQYQMSWDYSEDDPEAEFEGYDTPVEETFNGVEEWSSE